VEDYLSAEVRQGKIVEFLREIPDLHFSPFEVIPKKYRPGKWRLIVDLSVPYGLSVSDAINKEWCSLSYVSVDDVVKCTLQKCRGALVVKLDIKQAYRNIPVHPEDCMLLGMKWQGRVLADKVLADKVLPFGLWSVPMIFTWKVCFIMWMISLLWANQTTQNVAPI